MAGKPDLWPYYSGKGKWGAGGQGARLPSFSPLNIVHPLELAQNIVLTGKEKQEKKVTKILSYPEAPRHCVTPYCLSASYRRNTMTQQTCIYKHEFGSGVLSILQ